MLMSLQNLRLLNLKKLLYSVTLFPEQKTELMHKLVLNKNVSKSKLETMNWSPFIDLVLDSQEDQRYLIDVAGVRQLVKAEWRNPSKGPQTPDLIVKYYSQLTLSQLLQLYNIYRLNISVSLQLNKEPPEGFKSQTSNVIQHYTFSIITEV